MSAGGKVVKPQDEPGLLEQIAEAVMTPGSSLTATMQMVVNGTFVILAGILGMLVFVDPENIHLKIMMGLLLGLTLSTNWYAQCGSSQSRFFSLVLNNDNYVVIGEEGKGKGEGEKEGKKETKKDK